jgi:chromosome partitioning protein
MVPSFVKDWQSGLDRFKQANLYEFDKDTGVALKDKKRIQADDVMHNRIVKAIREDEESIDAYLIGDIEDANVLIQNSLWLNVPIGQLEHHQQVSDLQDRRKWAANQIEQIRLLQNKFNELAVNLCRVCGYPTTTVAQVAPMEAN